MSEQIPNLDKDDAEAIEWLSKEYPQIYDSFREKMLAQFVLFAKKHKGYGTSNINLGTQLDTPEDIQLALTGLVIRMLDKINRLKNIVVLKGEDKVGEAITDTLQDLSVYGIIAQIVQEGKFKK